MANYIVTN